MSATLFLPDEAATVAFGRALADATGGTGLLTLSGDLGTGKTTLSRGIVQALGHTGAVKSPTYTLVEPYEIGDTRIFHFDLYRLSDPEELVFTGARDYFSASSICLVEWPEKAFGVLPPADLEIRLAEKDRGREITCTPHTPRGKVILDSLQA